MTTYNTGNAIGSADPLDLYDNAQNLDNAVNSAAGTWVDRRGVTRPTFQGLILDAATRAEFAATDGATKIGYGAETVKAALDRVDGAVDEFDAKLGNLHLPSDNGAVGNGVDDDTTAINLTASQAVTTYLTTRTSSIGVSPRVDLILASPARRVSDSLIEERELSVPAGLGFTPQIRPIRKNGKWQGHVPALSLFPAAAGATYYVDPILGAPGAAGTEAAPLKSITEALQKSDVGRIFVAPAPNASLDDGAWGNPTITTPQANIIIKPWNIRPGRPTVSASWQHYESNWTQHVAYTRAYTASRTGVLSVWEFEDVESAIKLVEVATQAEVQNRPGSYHYDGTTLTVQTVRSTKPDRSLKVFHSNTCAYWNSNKRLYVQGFDFFGGGTGSFWVPDSTADFVLVDCRAGFTNGNAFYFNTSGKVVLENCAALYAALDGFNYHAAPTYGAGTMVEVGCRGVQCGWGGASNQVSTLHDGFKGLRIGGDYSGAQQQGIADVNVGTVSWNVGGSAGKSRDSGTLNVGVYLSESIGWFYDFDFGASECGLLLGGASAPTAYLHNSSPSTYAVNSGSISQYMQA